MDPIKREPAVESKVNSKTGTRNKSKEASEIDRFKNKEVNGDEKNKQARKEKTRGR